MLKFFNLKTLVLSERSAITWKVMEILFYLLQSHFMIFISIAKYFYYFRRILDALLDHNFQSYLHVKHQGCSWTPRSLPTRNTSPHYNVAASEMSNKEYIFCFFYFSIMYYCIHIFKVTKLDLNKKCLSIYKCIFPSLASQNLYFNVRFEWS